MAQIRVENDLSEWQNVLGSNPLTKLSCERKLNRSGRGHGVARSGNVSRETPASHCLSKWLSLGFRQSLLKWGHVTYSAPGFQHDGGATMDEFSVDDPCTKFQRVRRWRYVWC